MDETLFDLHNEIGSAYLERHRDEFDKWAQTGPPEILSCFEPKEVEKCKRQYPKDWRKRLYQMLDWNFAGEALGELMANHFESEIAEEFLNNIKNTRENGRYDLTGWKYHSTVWSGKNFQDGHVLVANKADVLFCLMCGGHHIPRRENDEEVGWDHIVLPHLPTPLKPRAAAEADSDSLRRIVTGLRDQAKHTLLSHYHQDITDWYRSKLLARP
jgi:hypothetical protein